MIYEAFEAYLNLWYMFRRTILRPEKLFINWAALTAINSSVYWTLLDQRYLFIILDLLDCLT